MSKAKCGLVIAVAMMLLCLVLFGNGFTVSAEQNDLVVKSVSTNSEVIVNGEQYNVIAVSFENNLTKSESGIEQKSEYSDLLSKIEFNGRSLSEIYLNKKDKWGNLCERAFFVDLSTYSGSSDIKLVLYFYKFIDENMYIKNDNSDTLVFNVGTSIEGAVIKEKETFRYERHGWMKCRDLSVYDYEEVKLSSVSAINAVGTYYPSTGRKDAVIWLYFNKPVAYKRISFTQASTSYLRAIIGKSELGSYRTEEDIQKIITSDVRHSIITKLYLDGKNIGEILNGETRSPHDEIAVCAHYEGAEYNTSALGIYVRGDAIFSLSPEEDHTIEIKQGFKTPLLGEIKSDYSFRYKAESNKWMNNDNLTKIENEKIDIKERDFTPTDVGDSDVSGCSGSFHGSVLVMFIIPVGVIVSIRRHKRRI